jgi:tyrosyl-tRNA synthetase
VRDFHSATEADAAAEGWARQFQQRAVSEDAPVVEVALSADGLVLEEGHQDGAVIRVPKLLQLSGLASSVGEATRKLAENAVSLNGERYADKALKGVSVGSSIALRLGKKSVRIKWVR